MTLDNMLRGEAPPGGLRTLPTQTVTSRSHRAGRQRRSRRVTDEVSSFSSVTPRARANMT